MYASNGTRMTRMVRNFADLFIKNPFKSASSAFLFTIDISNGQSSKFLLEAVLITKKGLDVLTEMDKEENENRPFLANLNEDEATKLNVLLDKLRET